MQRHIFMNMHFHVGVHANFLLNVHECGHADVHVYVTARCVSVVHVATAPATTKCSLQPSCGSPPETAADSMDPTQGVLPLDCCGPYG